MRDHWRLTEREKQIATLIALGYSSKEMAVELNIAVKTVLAHRAHIANKIGSGIAAVTRLAMREGWLKTMNQKGVHVEVCR